jgi:hypothetical protein
VRCRPDSTRQTPYSTRIAASSPLWQPAGVDAREVRHVEELPAGLHRMADDRGLTVHLRAGMFRRSGRAASASQAAEQSKRCGSRSLDVENDLRPAFAPAAASVHSIPQNSQRKNVADGSLARRYVSLATIHVSLQTPRDSRLRTSPRIRPEVCPVPLDQTRSENGLSNSPSGRRRTQC